MVTRVVLVGKRKVSIAANMRNAKSLPRISTDSHGFRTECGHAFREGTRIQGILALTCASQNELIRRIPQQSLDRFALRPSRDLSDLYG